MRSIDPIYIGPGIWYIIHSQALSDLYHEENKEEYVLLINSIADNFPCDLCKIHFKQYIKEHPIEDYFNIKLTDIDNSDNIGLFYWSWKYHNSVNTRLGKDILSFNTALSIYKKSNVDSD